MGYRRSKSSILDDTYEILLVMPFWVGPILAAIVYAAMYWLIPYFFSSPGSSAIAKTAWPILSGVSRDVSPWVGGLVLFVWCFAEFRKLSNRKLLDRTIGRDGIRNLKWQEFERLLAEAFRRQGYSVEHTGQSGPDGGIDLRLQRAGETKLVQCKHWRQRDVGVTILRELAGVVATERAHGGLVVSSGGFTPDAVAFAAKANLILIDGDELTRMISQVQSGSPVSSPDASAESVPTCPSCKSPMKLRTAKRGVALGSQFWGCSQYPECKTILPFRQSSSNASTGIIL